MKAFNSWQRLPTKGLTISDLDVDDLFAMEAISKTKLNKIVGIVILRVPAFMIRDEKKADVKRVRLHILENLQHAHQDAVEIIEKMMEL